MFRTTALALLAATVTALSVATAAVGFDDGVVASSPAGFTQIAAAHGLDLAEARRQANDHPGLDLVIDRADLGQWQALAARNPELFDGLNIGVMLEPADPDLARRVGEDLMAGRDPGSLTRAERVAASRFGSTVGDALDRRTGEAATGDERESPAAEAAACVHSPRQVTPGPDEVVVYFACYGDEPSARPETRPVDASLSAAERVRAALDLLVSPSAVGADAGLYSVLDRSHILRGVDVSGGVATVDFSSQLLQLGLANSVARSTTFLEQVTNTVFFTADVEQVNLTLDGDCAAFWRAMGGVGCHHASRHEPSNTRGEN